MARQEKVKFNIGEDWEVVHVRDTKIGVFFTLQLPGLSLYNLRYVPAGRKYSSFIGMPSKKGSDEKYYDDYTIYLSDDDTAAILEEVEKKLK